MPVEFSVALTWAFGTTAPEGSETVPLIAPRNVCAFTPTASDRTTRIARTRRFMIHTPLIEIEPQPTAPTFPDPRRSTLGKRKFSGQPSGKSFCFNWNFEILLSKIWTSPPDQLALP